ncbi:MAG: 2-oxoglutarate dehydrogenase complex dihydrolipoyllysine-residue succinyltransferase [Bdellovibrionaceae bacterium]|nr:2-oxoglutarate dehydrogenase complex dihydrolipoyllysine-residue succinyltransferase [Bdellovibrio sp.]
MKIEIKVPTVGESITEAVIGSWTKKSGDYVKMNDVIMLLETDKASVEVVAEKDGVLTINAQSGETVKIGATVGSIDTDGKASVGATPAPVTAAKDTTSSPQAPAPAPAPASGGRETHPDLQAHMSPAVQRVVNERGIDPATVNGTGLGGRLTKGDVTGTPTQTKSTTPPPSSAPSSAPSKSPAAPMVAPVVSGPSKQGDTKRVPMTNIRKKIAERLVQAQHNAAILTTFNEVDMTKIIELRAKYKDKFKEKYGVGLGFNGFFVKAAIEALKAFPAVNAWVDGQEIEYHNYYNIGMAVSTERGLMVPVIKDADLYTVAGIELAIRDLAIKGRDGKISVDDLNGGTFSITNGGVFGSLLSTPILNAPQSAILGLHKIEERAVVINSKVEVRSMMYVALSYDHRMIDGKEAVSFLVKIKEGVEDPERLLLEV